MSDAERMVLEFHRKYGFAIDDTSLTFNQLRADLIMEEAEEARDAILSADRAAIAKELADLEVVTHGAAITHGIDLDLALYLVHQSNMTKSHDQMRADGKLLKGPRYRAPNMEPALQAPRHWALSECICLRGRHGGIAVVNRECQDHGVSGRWPLVGGES